ncbi:hypothetical protein K501DRAFT_336075 [Backusella circina FSU 941]|nr:hypothetical protein K501DRAFT_336075 [Backusella circina FSU 941]
MLPSNNSSNNNNNNNSFNSNNGIRSKRWREEDNERQESKRAKIKKEGCTGGAVAFTTRERGVGKKSSEIQLCNDSRTVVAVTPAKKANAKACVFPSKYSQGLERKVFVQWQKQRYLVIVIKSVANTRTEKQIDKIYVLSMKNMSLEATSVEDNWSMMTGMKNIIFGTRMISTMLMFRRYKGIQ